MNSISKTNWEQVDSLKDDDIDTSDIAPLGDAFFENANLYHSKLNPKRTVTVEIDSETLSWYESQGESSQDRLSAALRLYAQAHMAQRRSA